MVIIMHKIPIPSEKVRTDLIVEQKGRNEKHIKREEKGLKVEDIIHNQERTTTIFLSVIFLIILKIYLLFFSIFFS